METSRKIGVSYLHGRKVTYSSLAYVVVLGFC